ncbi:MAG: LamG-like jellyroll fold domain-containing protein [Bacteroidota bacterium]
MKKVLLSTVSLLLSFLVHAQVPVAWYPFTGNANDASGNALNGTVNGAALTTDRFGVANSAYSFDGINDVISIPHNALLNGSSYSISVWYKYNGPGAAAGKAYWSLVSKNNNGTGYFSPYQLMINDSRRLAGRIGGGTLAQNIDWSTTDSINNQWHHVVYVFDNNKDSIFVYQDGVETLRDYFPFNAHINTDPVTIGVWNPYANFFSGIIDEVKIYNTALTSAQAKQNYNGLVAYYPFTGNANDAFGNLNGTVNGATLAADRFGVTNSAYSFDGVNDVVELNHNFGPFAELTVSAWYKVTAASPDLQAIISSDQSGKLFHMQTLTSGACDNAVYANTVSGSILLTHPMPTLNQWVQITITAKSGESKLYANGILIDTDNATFTSITAANLLRIGSGYLNGRFFNGCIDEVKIYNKALTAAQVLADYNSDTLAANYASQFGNSVLLNGNSDYISIPDNAALNPSILTAEAWVKPASFGLVSQIIHKAGTGANVDRTGFQLRSDAGSSYSFCVANATSQDCASFAITSNDLGKWMHIAGVYDGSTIKIFRDGVLMSTTPTSQTITHVSSPFLIGKRIDGFNFDGSIDEVHIWNTARTATEIQAGMNTQLTGNEAGLAGYWDMNRNGQGAGLIVDNKATGTGASLNGISFGTATTPVFSPAVAQQKPGSGNSIVFNGSDNSVDLGTSFTQQNFTVDMWVKPGATQVTYADIIDNNHSGSSTNWVCQQDGNNVNTYGFGTMNTSVGFTLTPNVWQHLTLVKSPTALEAYINGILIQSTPYSGGAINYSGNFLRLGKWGGGGRNWNGTMDEVRIWNTPLTQAQIRDRMCKKIKPSDPLFSNLAGYYNFDETTGNTAFDGSINANNGTLVNGPARLTSGAAIGDNSSHNYVTTGLPAANISSNGQDNLEVAYTAGTFTGTAGTHVYVVNEKPNTESGITGAGTNNRYFGVFNTNLAAPTYTATYNYAGNPFVTVANEPLVSLFKRNDNAATGWANTSATLNTADNTLTATGQNTEYMLGASTTQQVLKPGSGNAVSFDGVDDYGTIPHAANINFDVADNFTIDMWMKIPSAVQPDLGLNSNIVLEKYVTGQPNNNAPFTIAVYNGTQGIAAGRVNFSRANNSGGVGTTTVRSFNDDKFHHYAFQKNGTSLNIYVDGILQSTGVDFATGSVQNNAPVSIGRRADNTGKFKGEIDEVRIWNTSLTQAQVRDRMCRKITPADALFGNLAAYYNFDESSGSTVFDGSLSANNATLVNSPTRLISSAAIGDNSSHNYVTTGLPAASLSINGQDNLAVAYTAGTFTGEAGTHVYVVNEKPNTESGIAGTGTNDRYFGVFNANLTAPAYTATYNYTGNPFVTAANESLLGLFKRNDNSGTAWTTTSAAINTTSNTLTATGQNTEYMLGTQNALCNCVGENGTLTLSAPAGNVFTSIAFASYGTPTGGCGNYAIGPCHAANSQALVENAFLNQNTASIGASNGVFGDPCQGTGKMLCVQAIYGPAAINAPGVIGASQTICSSSLPALLNNVSSAIGNSGNPVVYQWQDSTIGSTWQDIGGAGTNTYQPPSLSVSTWYRRKVTIGAYIGFSNEVAIAVTVVAGIPSVFPVNSWNVYAYNGSDLELGAGVSYRGFYPINTLNLNSTNEWPTGSTPSAATGYQGCGVNADLFTWVYKRQGFPAGDYILHSTGVDDVSRILVNGVQVYQNSGPAAFNNITLGHLDANATIEIRCIEATGPAYANFSFAISPLQSGVIAGNQTGCQGFTPAALTSVAAAFGGASTTISYQWQQSANNISFTDVPAATSAGYQPPATSADTYYRRRAFNTASQEAFSDTVFVDIVPDVTPVIAINNRLLTASVTQGILSYIWFKDGTPIGGATTQSYTVPNTDSGSYTVACVNACGTGNQSAPVIISYSKADQTIAFDPVTPKVYGDAPFAINAVATSGLAVSYHLISGPATLAGNTVTITGVGTILLEARQPGNTQFNPAIGSLTVNVSKAAATITLSNLGYVYDGTGKAASATTNPLGLNNSITYNGNSALPVNAGSYNALATITSPNYQGTATDILTIGKANQTLSISPVPDKSFNSVPFIVTASSTAGLPVSLTLLTVPATGVASINGNTITLLGAGGTVTVLANQPGNINYNAATDVSTQFMVTPPLANDIQMVSLVSPAGGCSLGASSNIVIRLKNLGTASATGFNVSYTINDGTPVTEPITAIIAPGQSHDYTFGSAANFTSTNATYLIKAYANLASDGRLSNDTISTSVVRFAPPATGVSNDTAICTGGTATLRAFGGSVYNWTAGPTTANYTVSPAATTTYQVAVTDVNGCTTSNHSVTVTVNVNPTANAGNDTSILRGSSVTLTGTGGGTYLWNNGAGNTASVDVSPLNTTTYTVTVKNAAGCTTADNVLVTVNFSALNITPSIVDFGSIVQDSSASANITIVNNGTFTETISSIANLLAPFTTTFTAPQTLVPGASVTMAIKFKPTATLFYNNVFTMATSVGNFSITLKGRGVVAAPAWSVEPASYNYNKVPINTFVNKDFILRNTGNVSIKISSVSSSNTRYVGTVNGVTDLPIGGTVTLTIRFNPIAITTYDGTITVRTSTANLAIIKPIVTGKGYIPGPLPQLIYVADAPYSDTSGVSPKVGGPGVYTYKVIYKHPGGLAPLAGYPKAGIDKNADGDFADAGESLTAMTKLTAGTNWAAGIVYTFVTSLPISNNYGYQFFATDANGNDALPNAYKEGPLVTNQALDLHIFADDITFSNNHPNVNQDFTVNATIHNNSPFSAQEVNVRFYYKDSIYLFSDTIALVDPYSQTTLTHTLNFSPDGFYPIKVWIDSIRKQPEYNLLNNYASRPVIVGLFTVPGTIDVTHSATPDGCSKGKVIFSGTAKYRGLNLEGTPPVEGATVIIRVLNFDGAGTRTITTHTDNNGNYYVYDDPCTQDINPQDCFGYACGVVYNYSVEVTDFTLTSPAVSGTVTRPCVNCNPDGEIQYGSGVGCVLPNEPFNYAVNIANYSFDIFGNIRCAPTTYHDTITVYQNGALAYTHTRDSITRCSTVAFNNAFPGLPAGIHSFSFTHSYYTATGERREFSQVFSLDVPSPKFDLDWVGFAQTGPRSLIFTERNLIGCGAIPGGLHTVYLYDSLPGYVEKVLIDSFRVDTIGNTIGTNQRTFAYSNQNWPPGCHNLTMITDVGNRLPELREDNNVLTAVFCVPFPVFDVTAKTTKFSSSTVVAGSLINFSAKIQNKGAAITAPFKVGFRANGALVGTLISIPAMLVGEEIEIISAPYQIPTNPCPIKVITYADDENVIAEALETNNTDTAIFGININAGRSCQSEEDETIGAGFFSLDDPLNVCYAYEAPKGVQTYFSTTVRNNGTRDASNIKVRFTLFGNTIGSDVIPVLKAGKKVETGFFYTFDTVGRFIISAFADYTKEICEISETDNIGLIHIDTKPVSPDLQILSQHIAPSNLNPNPGQQITIASSILNVGTAPSRPAKVRFWVNDVPLGDDMAIDSIYPGADTTIMATVPYTSNVVGLKVIKVKADIGESNAERREDNNEATRGIIVGAAPDFANSVHEAITINPTPFSFGDTVTICNYLRNYGGETGTAWLRFSYIGADNLTTIIDSVQFTLASNDSMRVCLRWKVAAHTGVLVTEILYSVPPEFDTENNRDTLSFNAVLPLTLLSFTGNKSGNDIKLEWKSTSEINLARYEVERSSNGLLFSNINTVVAQNRNGNHSYTITDFNPWASSGNKLFYRLKMIDIDGRYRYSKIIGFTNSLFASIHVSPNPTSNILNVQLQAGKGKHDIKIMDAAGKIVGAVQHDLLEGSQVLRLDVATLAAGAYMILVQYPTGKMDRVSFIKAN